MGNCHVVGPNEVMVISGSCCSNNKRIIIGGCGWAWWGVSNVQKLSLNVMTLLPRCENVETKQGVSLTVTGVAQVMVMAEDHMAERGSREEQQQRDAFLHKALEQFLGKSEADIRDSILQVRKRREGGSCRVYMPILCRYFIDMRSCRSFFLFALAVLIFDLFIVGFRLFPLQSDTGRSFAGNSWHSHSRRNLQRARDVCQASARCCRPRCSQNGS